MRRRRPFTRAAALIAAALLTLALAPAAPVAAASAKGPLGQFKHLVVIYEENHSFDNLYGHVGRGRRPARHRPVATPTRPTRSRSPRTARPYNCLKQLDVNLDVAAAGAAPAAPTTVTFRRRGHDGVATSRNAPVQHRRLHPGRRTTCPDRRPPVQLAERRRSNGTRAARRLHPRPGPPVLPGAVPAQRRAAEPLRDRQRRGRHDDGLLRHDRSCRSTSTCTAEGARTTSSPTTSSRRRSAARSSTTST